MKTPQKDNNNRSIFILSLVGIGIAAYVTQSFIRHSPIICVNTGCELVRKNPVSYLMGVPIPMFGLVGYTILAVLTFLRTVSVKMEKILLPYIAGVASGGVLFVAWFTYTELFVIRAFCTWCAISAVNMIIICVIAWKMWRYEKRSI